MSLISRSFRHYFDKEGNGGVWYHCLINPMKMFPLTNPHHKAFRDFLYNVVIAKKVPNQYFTEDADRCCTMNGFECNVIERPSRYQREIEKALSKQEDRQRHYVVQKELVENSNTWFIVGELPVWLPEGQRVGHIDLIEFAEGKPSLVIWDFKPALSTFGETWTGQTVMYKYILSTMLNIPLSEIMVGAFDNIKEEIMVEE